MSIINQDTRYAERGTSDNPLALYDYVKPSRSIVGSGVPSPTTGEDQWHYIDASTSIEYVKVSGAWTPLVNYASIVAPSLPPATVPDNILADTLDNKNTGDLAISAAAALTLNSNTMSIVSTGSSTQTAVTDMLMSSATGMISLTTAANVIQLNSSSTIDMTASSLNCVGLTSGISGVSDITGVAASTMNVESFGDLDLKAALVNDINMTGNVLDCVGLTNGITNCDLIQGKPLSNMVLTSADSIYLQAGAGSTIYPTAATMSCVGLSSGINGVSSLNDSSVLTNYKVLGTNTTGALSWRYAPTTVTGIISNLTTTAGVQYWSDASGSSPADFYCVSLPTDVPGGSRALTGLTATILHNAVGWNITAGTVDIRVGYVAGGNPILVANIVPFYTSTPFAVASAYPYVNITNINPAMTVPISARIVIWVEKGLGVGLSNLTADIVVCAEFR